MDIEIPQLETKSNKKQSQIHHKRSFLDTLEGSQYQKRKAHHCTTDVLLKREPSDLRVSPLRHCATHGVGAAKESCSSRGGHRSQRHEIQAGEQHTSPWFQFTISVSDLVTVTVPFSDNKQIFEETVIWLPKVWIRRRIRHPWNRSWWNKEANIFTNQKQQI